MDGDRCAGVRRVDWHHEDSVGHARLAAGDEGGLWRPRPHRLRGHLARWRRRLVRRVQRRQQRLRHGLHEREGERQPRGPLGCLRETSLGRRAAFARPGSTPRRGAEFLPDRRRGPWLRRGDRYRVLLRRQEPDLRLGPRRALGGQAAGEPEHEGRAGRRLHALHGEFRRLADRDHPEHEGAGAERR